MSLSLLVALCHFAACGLDPLGNNKAAERQRALRDSTTRAIVTQYLQTALQSDSLARRLSPRNADLIQVALKKLYEQNDYDLIWQQSTTRQPSAQAGSPFWLPCPMLPEIATPQRPKIWISRARNPIPADIPDRYCRLRLGANWENDALRPTTKRGGFGESH